MHMYGLQKEGTDETVCKTAMENTEIEKTLMDKGRGKEGVGEMNGESSMEAYTLTYVNRQPLGIYFMGIQGTQTVAL